MMEEEGVTDAVGRPLSLLTRGCILKLLCSQIVLAACGVIQA